MVFPIISINLLKPQRPKYSLNPQLNIFLSCPLFLLYVIKAKKIKISKSIDNETLCRHQHRSFVHLRFCLYFWSIIPIDENRENAALRQAYSIDTSDNDSVVYVW